MLVPLTPLETIKVDKLISQLSVLLNIERKQLEKAIVEIRKNNGIK